MKKRFILTITLLSVVSLFQPVAAEVNTPSKVKNENEKSTVSAPKNEDEWEFYSVLKDPSAEELSAVMSNHKFGKKVAFLYEAFKDAYVTKEEVVPGDPNLRTVIRKPEIYNAVRSVEKELNREIKKNECSLDEAKKSFEKVLQVSLAALDAEIPSFESALQTNKKDASQLLAIFQRVELKSLY
ncbi:MAG: hypothetical protein ACRC3Z_11750 [Phocaeicola sp.]